jgi:ribonuclease-3
MLSGVFNYLAHLFKKDKDFYFKLIGIIGFLPSKISLYKIAFTHKSVTGSGGSKSSYNNERLEYLGDAVLGAIVAEYIYKEFGHENEGFMTKLRARIVKRKHLNSTAIKMGIPMMINSNLHTANMSKHLYGNALEALFGAIYIDKGYRTAARFFRRRMVKKHIDFSILSIKDSDYKSQLIEWSQKQKKEVVFSSNEEYDPEKKAPTFEAIVEIDHLESGRGKGDSKKEAEQQAAKVAMKEISQ